jgi:hypothetical protein
MRRSHLSAARWPHLSSVTEQRNGPPELKNHAEQAELGLLTRSGSKYLLRIAFETGLGENSPDASPGICTL